MPNYGLEGKMYASVGGIPQDDKNKKLKTIEELQNPNKQGTGEIGKQQDLKIILEGDQTKDEYKEALWRIGMNQYHEPVDLKPSGNGYEPGADPQAPTGLDDPDKTNTMLERLRYQSLDDFLSDFSSSNEDVKLELGGMLTEIGKQFLDIEYMKLAFANYAWIANNRRNRINSDLNFAINLGFGLEHIYQFAKANGDRELMQNVVNNVLSIYPQDPTHLERLRELQAPKSH